MFGTELPGGFRGKLVYGRHRGRSKLPGIDPTQRCAAWFAGSMGLFAAVLRVEFHIPLVHSLKEKRGIIKPVIDGLKNRFNVSVAETDFQDLWQRCEIGIGVVASSASHAQDVIDECDRFVWSFPEITITTTNVVWLEPE